MPKISLLGSSNYVVVPVLSRHLCYACMLLWCIRTAYHWVHHRLYACHVDAKQSCRRVNLSSMLLSVCTVTFCYTNKWSFCCRAKEDNPCLLLRVLRCTPSQGFLDSLTAKLMKKLVSGMTATSVSIGSLLGTWRTMVMFLQSLHQVCHPVHVGGIEPYAQQAAVWSPIDNADVQH